MWYNRWSMEQTDIGVYALKTISRAIDRFCLKHRRFGIPRLMMYIVPISALIYIINQMDTTGLLLDLMAFHPGLILRGQIWRLATWVFLPLNDSLIFTALMLLFYYFIGNTLERAWGTSKFTVYYLMGTLLNIIYGFSLWFLYSAYAPADFLDSYWLGIVWLAPNYLNLSMFFAFAVLFPDQVIRVYFILPIKIKWLALANVLFFLYSIVSSIWAGYYAESLLPIIALLNFIFICGGDLLAYLRPIVAKASPRSMSFRKAARQASMEFNDIHGGRKCAVCGITNDDNPDVEFRYCSRCSGYHCFCDKHIGNHIHFQE